jgi:hypothetical protein
MRDIKDPVAAADATAAAAAIARERGPPLHTQAAEQQLGVTQLFPSKSNKGIETICFLSYA